MKQIYFPNNNTYGPFSDGRSYSEGVVVIALNVEDEQAMDDIARGGNSSLIAHLARVPASCCDGKISVCKN